MILETAAHASAKNSPTGGMGAVTSLSRTLYALLKARFPAEIVLEYLLTEVSRLFPGLDRKDYERIVDCIIDEAAGNVVQLRSETPFGPFATKPVGNVLPFPVGARPRRARND
jgi:hypothetical protein